MHVSVATNQNRVDGSVLSHFQIAESVREDPVKKQSRVRSVYNCGRSDASKVAVRLRRFPRKILKRCSLEEFVECDPKLPSRNVDHLRELGRRSVIRSWW